MKHVCVLLFSFCCVFRINAQINSEKIKLPFDTITEKYAVQRVITVSGKSALELYKATKAWLEVKYAGDKFIWTDTASDIYYTRYFTINVTWKGNGVTRPMVETILYNVVIQFKNGKSKILINNFRSSKNALGTTNEKTIEAIKLQAEQSTSTKKSNENLVIDLFNEIEISTQKVLAELEAAMKGAPKKDDW